MASARNGRTTSEPEHITKAELQSSTLTRKWLAIATSVFYALATIFLILVNIGNLRPSKGLSNMFLFKLDVTNVVPENIPNASLVNSIARTIGLHDFYQVGMWNFCEGYNDQGVTSCSPAKLLYWFNPVEIIEQELLAGATIDFPAEVTHYLNIIRLASQVMFGCWFASTLSSFILIFLAPFAVFSKLLTIPICIFATLSTLATVIGAGISTGMWSIFKKYIKQYASTINVIPTIGKTELALMWIAAGSALFGMLFLMALMCCGTSRRDIKTGRRTSRSHWREKVVSR